MLYSFFSLANTFLQSCFQVSVNLKTADGKRFKSTYSLYERIDPENSKYEVLNTKVELVLKKGM